MIGAKRRFSGLLVALVASAALAPACKREPAPDRPVPADASASGDAVASGDAGDEPAVAVQTFASLDLAIAHIMASKPRVLGVGEFHQTARSAPVRSTLERFTDAFATLSASASDLVLETWLETGACGKTETAVIEDVQRTTQRPPIVENQLARLLAQAKQRGVRRHILAMQCRDYEAVRDEHGAVDYTRMLELIKRKLAEAITRASALPRGPRGSPATIVVYGGAFHNDLYPYESTASYSYAADVTGLVSDGYVELDLYVPEYIAGNKLLRSEVWFPVFERQAAPDRVLLFERAPRSYIVILPTGDRAAAPAPRSAPAPAPAPGAR